MILQTEQDLIAYVNELRSSWKTIVTTNGCFDILHPGHIETFRQAKTLWDIFIVLVNSDANPYFRTKPGRPINNELSRMILLESMKHIDAVYLFSEETPSSVLQVIQPHIHVKWWDYIKENLPEYEIVRAYGGDIEIIPTVSGYSSTAIIEKICKTYRED